ncbi:MAG TPA: bifunctional diaminohydroxyphosphoribosylaminopyrimidine deaminase/5-amino-6-(5-phosphoribosylamino)uracil reductase RibD [Blastocatellia bacterium]|nr:bifunctional diaminohydroxyphosphoribosylaminopyrimidine deaminase/5-amino-6-(5-phosphoribosylamino)uracil reductase RibD [Blastocatellia bacterium]
MKAGLMFEEDKFYMQRALDLARKGAGLVSPNPMVGAVLVSEGQVVGEGFHRYDLLKHAETVALERAGERARGATLYCSLEPCCHHGRTPPCTDSLIEAGISRAVIALRDPDPRVDGRGIELLRRAGIEIEVGLNESEARRLNEIYLKYITTGLPFTHALFLHREASLWEPSADLREIASWYDALVLGDCRDVNRSIRRAVAGRVRHRPIRVAALLRSGSHARAESESDVAPFSTPEELQSIFRSWTSDGVSSVFVLPFLNDESYLDAIETIDKATIIHATSGEYPLLESIEREVVDGSGYREVTGYLAKRD